MKYRSDLIKPGDVMQFSRNMTSRAIDYFDTNLDLSLYSHASYIHAYVSIKHIYHFTFIGIFIFINIYPLSCMCVFINVSICLSLYICTYVCNVCMHNLFKSKAANPRASRKANRS